MTPEICEGCPGQVAPYLCRDCDAAGETQGEDDDGDMADEAECGDNEDNNDEISVSVQRR